MVILVAFGRPTGAIAGQISFSGTADASGLPASTFATGLDSPYRMTMLSDSALLVGSTVPLDPNSDTGYYAGSGQLLRFTDSVASSGGAFAGNTSAIYEITVARPDPGNAADTAIRLVMFGVIALIRRAMAGENGC